MPPCNPSQPAIAKLLCLCHGSCRFHGGRFVRSVLHTTAQLTLIAVLTMSTVWAAVPASFSSHVEFQSPTECALLHTRGCFNNDSHTMRLTLRHVYAHVCEVSNV